MKYYASFLKDEIVLYALTWWILQNTSLSLNSPNKHENLQFNLQSLISLKLKKKKYQIMYAGTYTYGSESSGRIPGDSQ
jgi:hypothetical protein